MRFLVRDFRGLVSRESSDRPVDAKGDDDVVTGVACAHMLYRCVVLVSVFAAKSFYRECQVRVRVDWQGER